MTDHCVMRCKDPIYMPEARLCERHWRQTVAVAHQRVSDARLELMVAEEQLEILKAMERKTERT